MLIYISKVYPLYVPASPGVSVQFELESVDEAGSMDFTLERSGSPDGPWDEVATGTDVYTLTDDLDSPAGFEGNLLSLQRDLYYRVKVTPPSGVANEVYSRPVNLDGHAETSFVGPDPVIGHRADTSYQYEEEPLTNLSERPRRPTGEYRLRLLRRKILRDEYILFKNLAGIEFYLLKRKHFGVRCPDCYDTRTRSVMKSKCDSCYGTSWSDGYFTAVPVLGRRATSQISSSMSPQAKMETNLVRIQFLDFPRIDEEDVLVEKAHNRRYLVKSRYYTFLKTVPVHQTVTVSELERQAVEYDIPIP